MKKNNREQKYCCKWGPDIETSTKRCYQLRFRLINKAKQKFLSSTIKLSEAAVPGWTLEDPAPESIPVHTLI